MRAVTVASIGIDTGGTFTDFVLHLGAGRHAQRHVHKVLSTPDDPARAVLAGLDELAARVGLSIREVGKVVYGSTVATNALLERRGARVCLVTTAGFEDVIEIGRQARPRLYELEPERPRPLVARADRIGVRERVRFDGRAIESLTRRELGRLVRRVRARKPQAIAVAFLHAYAAPRHERLAARALAPLAVPISLSHALAREHREYERTSTAVANAYLAPLMSRHLARLTGGVPRRRLRVMQSNGGAVPPAIAMREPVRTILSGPAGGVVGAARVATRAGITRLLTLDMGGTSTDVALVDGAIPHRSDWELEGLAIRVPVIDIHTVGAGGGSIARCDAGGSLRVGPESAGADPGPACYGRGREPTVTDANLVLGRLDPARFLGGRLRLDASRAAAALDRLARPLGTTRLGAAEGVVRVTNAAMARALRVMSVERGRDPRDLTLVAFGGAAGLHACELADELAMQTILIPRHPGLVSAAGMAEAELARDYVQTVRLVDPSFGRLASVLAPLRRAGMADLATEGAAVSALVVRPFAQVRYLGQAHEIEVPLTAAYRRAFDRTHARLYGHAAAERPVEVVALRVTVAVRARSSAPRRHVPRARRAPGGRRQTIFWHGRALALPCYERDALRPGTRLRGPALLLEYSSTVLVTPGWRGAVDADGNLRLSR